MHNAYNCTYNLHVFSICVRVYARNLSAIGSDDVCDDLVKEDIMTPLSALLRDCLSRLEQQSLEEREIVEGEREEGNMEASTVEGREDCVKVKKTKHRKRLKVDVERQQLTEVLEQALHLLCNIR